MQSLFLKFVTIVLVSSNVEVSCRRFRSRVGPANPTQMGDNMQTVKLTVGENNKTTDVESAANNDELRIAIQDASAKLSEIVLDADDNTVSGAENGNTSQKGEDASSVLNDNRKFHNASAVVRVIRECAIEMDKSHRDLREKALKRIQGRDENVNGVIGQHGVTSEKMRRNGSGGEEERARNWTGKMDWTGEIPDDDREKDCFERVVLDNPFVLCLFVLTSPVWWVLLTIVVILTGGQA